MTQTKYGFIGAIKRLSWMGIFGLCAAGSVSASPGIPMAQDGASSFDAATNMLTIPALRMEGSSYFLTNVVVHLSPGGSWGVTSMNDANGTPLPVPPGVSGPVEGQLMSAGSASIPRLGLAEGTFVSILDWGWSVLRGCNIQFPQDPNAPTGPSFLMAQNFFATVSQVNGKYILSLPEVTPTSCEVALVRRGLPLPLTN